MKMLHTADWHVGKVLHGRSRADEHGTVLRNLVAVADEEDVDVVLVAGDLFDSATPSPDSQGLVTRALLALRAEGRQVVALAGNHDNPYLIDQAYRPVFGELGVHLVGHPRPRASGGALSLTTRSGEALNVAVLPFVAHRYAVRAAEAMLHEASQHAMDYGSRVRAMVEQITAGFAQDSVNVVMTHVTMFGGRRGGGERDFQTSLDYELSSAIFPVKAHYAALGHLHRRQDIPGPCRIAYSGSPLSIDFGEEENNAVALIVTVEPDTPASLRDVEIEGGRRLATLRGSLEQVIAAGADLPDAWLRIILEEKARAGLGDLVREKLPNALTVDLADDFRAKPGARTAAGQSSRAGRGPDQLFADYMREANYEDDRVLRLFKDILEGVVSPAPAQDAAEGEGESAGGAGPTGRRRAASTRKGE